ncbi:MAG TPA: ferritin family protein, partial [Candidatus Limnocylindrales bacterium]|nr:ferritin family protein [Candidatus Limnocylindrales bacterium]
MTAPEDVRRWRKNLQGEIDGAAVYRAMAEGTDEASLADLYRRMADAEERHGGLWRERLEAAGLRPGSRPSWRARV